MSALPLALLYADFSGPLAICSGLPVIFRCLPHRAPAVPLSLLGWPPLDLRLALSPVLAHLLASLILSELFAPLCASVFRRLIFGSPFVSRGLLPALLSGLSVALIQAFYCHTLMPCHLFDPVVCPVSAGSLIGALVGQA